MIDLTIASSCSTLICMSIDIGSIVAGMGFGVFLTYLLAGRIFRENKKE